MLYTEYFTLRGCSGFLQIRSQYLMPSTACPIKLSDHVAINDFYLIISADLSSLAEMIDYMFAEMIGQKPLIAVLSL